MSLKFFLILMTIVAVISDSMLHPFYPQYFSQVFHVDDPQHVGAYIAACSITVMLTFPVWALIAKRIPVLKLLIGTQIMTGILSLISYAMTDLYWFWGVSLLSMVFKASYLLIYPYVMSLEEKNEHINTIGLLAFVVYFGNILAALLSGLVFQMMDPRFLFVAMAAGDVLQIGICVYLLRDGGFMAEVPEPEEEVEAPLLPQGFVLKLGLIMMLLYFSAYLTEPFFSVYWEKTAATDNKILSGVVFAIPGLAALLALYVNSKSEDKGEAFSGIAPAILLGIVGLLLQASGSTALLIIGRFIYGWALFQSMVRLDLLLFKLSRPETYATDFSKINLFQALGVQFAAGGAGSLVFSSGLQIPFLAAALGFLIAVSVFAYVFRKKEIALDSP